MSKTEPFLGAPNFLPALAAARAAAGGQDYPAGALYVVATPIGNLADIGLRALHVLDIADAVACEDTRHTQQLLRAYGLDGKALIALHEHNELQAAQTVLVRLQAGEPRCLEGWRSLCQLSRDFYTTIYARLDITIDIQATKPGGFDESEVRTIGENARVLKFDPSSGFEKS